MRSLLKSVALLSIHLFTVTASKPFHLRLTSQNATSTPYDNSLLLASYQDYDLSNNPYYALIPSNSTTTGTIFHIDTHTLHAQLPINGTGKKTTEHSIYNLLYADDVEMVLGKGRSVYLKFNGTDERLTFVPEPMAATNEASWRVCEQGNGVQALFLEDGPGICTPVFLEKVLV